MAFPTNLDELREQKYVFSNCSHCSGCGAQIEWYKTPRGKKIPMSIGDGETRTAHWSDCPKAGDFRKKA